MKRPSEFYMREFMKKIQTLLSLLSVLFVLSSCLPNDTTPYPTPTPGPDDEKDETGEHRENENNDAWVRQQMDGLTDGYRNVPSSDRVTGVINNLLSGQVVDCLPGGIPGQYSGGSANQKLHPAAQGARKLLATLFQSCKAIDIPITASTPDLRGVEKAKQYGSQKGVAGGYLRKITNTQAYVSSHIVLKELENDPNYPAGVCKDATARPPVYGYGSTARASGGELKLFQGGAGVASGSRPASGIDCSAFISAALASQGLKMSKKSGPYERVTTTGFHSKVNSANSCLNHAAVSADDPIRPGDMINKSGSHIVMVDAVGEDPLGIKKHSAAGTCDSITTRDFDFTYIHSGSIKGSYGPSRVKASMHSGGAMWNSMRVMAVKLCKKKVKNDTEYADSRMAGMDTRLSVIRHKTTDPECIGSTRMKLEGEECVDKCSNIEKDVKGES